MLVKDVMTKENLAIISPTATIRDAIKQMKEQKVKSLIVDKARPSDAYGLLTYKNIIFSIIANDEDIDLLRVYDVYSKPAFQVSEELDIKYAIKLMVNGNIKRILVIDNNELEGILTMSDIMESYMQTIKQNEA